MSNTPSSSTQKPSSALRELTFRVVVMGLVLAVVMGAANVYLGLKAGMTVSASIPAAVLAMVLFRVLGGGSILEANQVQTTASAGESLAAGIIFTMPALILVGAWDHFDFWTTAMIAFTGGLLGILFMVPMRRVFVTGGQNPELSYPEGLACAAVLKAGENENASEPGAASVVWGALIGFAFKASSSFLGLLHGTVETAATFGSRVFYYGADISPALFAVGYIVRLNVALLIFIGGALSWLIGIPMLSHGSEDIDVLAQAWSIWSEKIRYIGVGAMVVGGVASIWKVRGGLLRALQEVRRHVDAGADRSAGPESSESKLAPDSERDRDLPGNVLVGFSILAAIAVGAIYYHLTGDLAIAAATTVIMLVMAFFFSAVASYIVGLVGNSNSPVSGMTITAVLCTGGLLHLFGFSGTEGIVATLGVAAVVCCAACTSGDVCNDLKTGSLVGASPRRQQVMQIAGIFVASLVMAPILQLLHENTEGGIGGRELPAPQAGLFASLADGFFGGGKLPWNLVAIGAIVGVLVLIVDRILMRANTSFRAHLMPIAVGMYLPFGLTTPIVLGGLVAYWIARKENASTDEEVEKVSRGGVLISSGIIAGESLTGVGLALATSFGIGSLTEILRGVDAETNWPPLSSLQIDMVSIVAGFFIVWLFYRMARPRRST